MGVQQQQIINVANMNVIISQDLVPNSDSNPVPLTDNMLLVYVLPVSGAHSCDHGNDIL